MRTKEMRTRFISKIISGNVQEYRRHKLKNWIYDYFIDNRFNEAPDRQPEDY